MLESSAVVQEKSMKLVLDIHLVSCPVILLGLLMALFMVMSPLAPLSGASGTCVLPSGGRRTLMANSNNWQKIDRGAFQLEGEK